MYANIKDFLRDVEDAYENIAEFYPGNKGISIVAARPHIGMWAVDAVPEGADRHYLCAIVTAYVTKSDGTEVRVEMEDTCYGHETTTVERDIFLDPDNPGGTESPSNP